MSLTFRIVALFAPDLYSVGCCFSKGDMRNWSTADQASRGYPSLWLSKTISLYLPLIRQRRLFWINTSLPFHQANGRQQTFTENVVQTHVFCNCLSCSPSCFSFVDQTKLLRDRGHRKAHTWTENATGTKSLKETLEKYIWFSGIWFNNLVCTCWAPRALFSTSKS